MKYLLPLIALLISIFVLGYNIGTNTMGKHFNKCQDIYQERVEIDNEIIEFYKTGNKLD